MATHDIPAPHAHYRPDVDGLRAFAVVSIIAYHLRLTPLKGAFVTLDIFFVISGYLIGAHILRDLDAGRFSLRDFYLRRVRRIIPALAAMLGATALAGTLLLYPDELARFGQSLAAASLAGANFFFWADTDYFAPPAQTAPLLHTWSLGVEEQFYLIFPALMLLLHRTGGARRTKYWLAGLLLASLAVATVTALRAPSLAFYFPHTRMWEFFAGTMIVCLPDGSFARRQVREAATVTGLAMIAASMLWLRPTMPFPGVAAAPAVFGTALVIAAGAQGDTLGSRLLAIAPARWIGRISYSLYLWHWPLILLYKAAKPAQDLARDDKVALFVATFVLAALSWRVVEEPFRRSRRRPAIVFASAAAAMIALAATGLLLWRTGGLPGRIDPVERRIVAWERSRVPPRAPGCHIAAQEDAGGFDPATCLAPRPGAPSVLLLGDSYANHLRQALAAQSGADVLQATSAGCRPALDAGDARDPACGVVRRAATAFLARHRPDLVVLAGRWSAEDEAPLERLLHWLSRRGQQVVIVGPVAEYDASLPKLLALAHRRHDPMLPSRHLVPQIAAVDVRMAALARRYDVRYLSPWRATCPAPARCVAVTPRGAPIEHDYGHFTVPGAAFVLQRMLAGRPLVERGRPADQPPRRPPGP